MATTAACAELDPPDGALLCDNVLECPPSWSCEARGGQPPRCWNVVGTGGGGGTPDQTGKPSYGNMNAPPVAYACGRWHNVSFAPSAPADAFPYGAQAIAGMAGQNYVCRFPFRRGDTTMMLQGRGVPGFGCLAVLPGTETIAPSPEVASRYDILVGTEVCANASADTGAFEPLATGFDADKTPTYTCIAEVESTLLPGVLDKMIGRLDQARRQCVFVQQGNVVAESGRYQVLVAPMYAVVLEQAP